MLLFVANNKVKVINLSSNVGSSYAYACTEQLKLAHSHGLDRW